MQISRFFAYLDFYKIVTIQYPTKLGVACSLFSVILIIFLVIPEVRDFVSLKLYKTISIQGFDEIDPIPLNIEIEFPEICCQLVSISIQNENNKLIDIPKFNNSLIFQRKKGNDSLDYNYIDPMVNKNFSRYPDDLKLLISGVLGNEGCLIKGIIKIEKWPEIIHIHSKNTNINIATAKLLIPLQMNNLKYYYYIRNLLIGTKVDFPLIADKIRHSNNKYIFRDGTCLSYILAIPHTYTDLHFKKKIQFYKYSFDYECVFSPKEEQDRKNEIQINMEQFVINYSEFRPSAFILFRNFIIIICGIYLLFSLFCKICHQIHQKFNPSEY